MRGRWSGGGAELLVGEALGAGLQSWRGRLGRGPRVGRWGRGYVAGEAVCGQGCKPGQGEPRASGQQREWVRARGLSWDRAATLECGSGGRTA